MVYVHVINTIDEGHLSGVIEEMKSLGVPRVRVVNAGDCFIALEGSHRLEAAKRLGLVPRLRVVAEGSRIVNHDVGDLPEDCSAAEISEYCRDACLQIHFDEVDLI